MIHRTPHKSKVEGSISYKSRKNIHL